MIQKGEKMKVWEKCLAKDISQITQAWKNFALTGKCVGQGGEIRCSNCPFDHGECGIDDDEKRASEMRRKLNQEWKNENQTA